MSYSRMIRSRGAHRDRIARRRMTLLGLATILSLLVSLFPQVMGQSAPAARAADPQTEPGSSLVQPTAPLSSSAFLPEGIDAGPTPIQFFYLPLPEDQVMAAFKVITPNTGTAMTSVTSIAVPANNTVIYYDQWEDGYELDVTNPAKTTTLIWGDGNASNGDVCSLASPSSVKPASLCVAPDTLKAGAVIILRNDVPMPRNSANLFYDARDKVSATRVVSMARSVWYANSNPGTMLADASEAYDTSRWGADYRLPIGEDLNTLSTYMFEYVSLVVMASQDGTTVAIDKNGDGTTDVTTTLNQGGVYQVSSATVGDLTSNARVTSDKPVQAHLLTGDIGSSYEQRWFTLLPTSAAGPSYYTPVTTVSTTYPAAVFVYNPDQTNAITVNYQTQAGSGSFSVAAKGVYRFAMPSLSGAHFYTTGAPFMAVGAMDTTTNSGATTQNQTYDWGYSLIPETSLTTRFVVGWAPGTGDVPPAANGSPVWAIATQATTLYVDYDGDPATGANTAPNGAKYDVSYAVAAFESKRIWDPDKDQTGMRVFTADGTLIAGAWGEDPTTAQPGSPYLDVGYTIPPLPEVVVDKEVALVVDNNSNGLVEPGDTLEYTISAKNVGVVVILGVTVMDELATNTTYVAGSTLLNGSAVPDDTSGTPYPLDSSGYNIGNIALGATSVLKFRVTANSMPPTYTTIVNTGAVQTDYDTYTVRVETPVNQPAITSCVLDFTGSGGGAASVYIENGTVYVQISDGDRNTNSSTAETVTVEVQNPTTGDRETVTLTETGVNIGIFRGSVASSATGGQSVNDGTLYARSGDTITAAYTDPVNGDTCSDTAAVTLQSLAKILYLSTDGTDNDFSGALDRVDPVATGDTTTSTSAVLQTTTATTPAVDNSASATNAAAVSTIAVDASANASNAAAVATIAVDNSASAVNAASATALAVDNTSEGVLSNAASANISHTTGTGSNRLMLVGVSCQQPGASVTALTYAGVSLTKVGSRANSSQSRVEIWRLTNPATGTNSLLLQNSQSDNCVVGITTFTGVDLTIPLGTFVSAQGSSTTASVTASSATDQLVFGAVAFNNGDADLTPGASQTEYWDNTVNSSIAGAGGTKAGASSVAVSWTSTSASWAIGAVPIRPATTGGGTTGVTISSFTTGAGTNRLMLVGVSIDLNSASAAVSSVTYGAQSLTLVGAATNTSNERVELWRLLSPTSGTANVVVTMNGQLHNGIVAGVTTFTGVDQTTPLGTFVSATGTSTAPSVTASSTTGDLVFAAVAAGQGVVYSAVGAGQTSRWNVTDSADIAGAGSTEAGAASVVMSWTSNSVPWAIGAVPIRPSGFASTTAGVTISGFTTGSGSNRLMLVGVSIDLNSASAAVSSVTYGAQSLTLVGAATNGSSERVELWQLLSPTSGSANVVVTMNGQLHNGIVAGVTTFTGVDQTTPLGTLVTATGTSTTPSVTATSASGELVFAAAAAGQAAVFSAVGAGQTSRWNVTDSADIAGAGSTEAGAASVVMSWTSNSVPWAIAAVPIKPSGFASTTAGVTISGFTTGSGSNRLMLVGVSIDLNSASAAVSSVTYGAQSLTLVGAATNTSNERVELWQLLSPASGTADVVVTMNGQLHNGVVAGVTTFTGVNQTTPLGTAAGQGGTSTAPSVTVTAAINDLVFAAVAAGQGVVYSAVGAGQTSRWNVTDSADIAGAGSTKTAAATSVTMSWTSTSVPWAIQAVAVKPSGTSETTPATFTQTPAMASDFTMPAGTISASTWVSTTGTLNTANLTAQLKYGATTIATLTNPTATLVSGGTETITTVGAAAQSIHTGTASTYSFAYNSGTTGSNRALFVGVSYRDSRFGGGNWPDVTSVTYGGQAMTQVGVCELDSGGFFSNSAKMYIFRRVSPPTGSNTLTVTWDQTLEHGAVIGAVTYSGVNPTTPTGTFACATGSSTTPSVTVVGAPERLMFGVIDGMSTSAYTVTGGGTQLWSGVAESGETAGSGQSKPGAASVALTWSGSNADWAAGGVSIIPASSPAIYRLDWSTPLTGAVTVPSGQAIALTVTNSGATPVQVLYDSSTYPSQVSLPTTTVIDLTSLQVYDAAYPGGSLVLSPYPGQTVYVRVTATDPFGAADITSAALTLAGAPVTLNDTYVVASTANSKTYEYAWTTPGVEAACPVSAVVNEGYETGGAAISDTASLPLECDFQDTGTPSTTEFTTGNNGTGTDTYNPNQQVCVRVTDGDQNQSATVAETVTAVITSSSGDSETITLTETGVNTGVFTNCITASSTSNSSGTIYAPSGSTLHVTYTDPTDASDTSSDDAVVTTNTAAMSISKTRITPQDSVAVVGETVRFDVVVGNPGTTSLTTVSVTDSFPSACLSYQSASITPNTVGASTLTWTNIGPIAVGGSKTISVYFTAIADCDPATNTASASGADQYSQAVSAGPVSAQVTTTNPSVTVVKTLLNPVSGTATVSETVTFQIDITNNGSTTITSLPLTDQYSASCIEYVSATPAASGGGGNLLWSNLGPLTVGATTSVIVNFHVEGPCDPATNLAIVDSATDANGDAAPPVQDDATVVTVATAPEVTVIKTLVTPAGGVANIGDTIQYQVAIQDTGVTDITTLSVTDTYDSACLSFVSASITPTGTSAGQVTWNTLIPTEPPLLAGGSKILTLTFTALAGKTSCLNSVSVSGQDEFSQSFGPLTSQASVQILLRLSGTVFDDANGSQVQDLPGEGSALLPVPTGLYVNLLDSTGATVIATTTVNPDGTYNFSSVTPSTSYVLQLSTNAGTVGQPAPAVALPANWVTTGENASGVPDGTADSLLSVAVVTTDVTGQNFGIEQLPDSDDKAEPLQANPGGTVQAPVPALSGSDPEDGLLGAGSTLKITSLPTTGTLYYDGVAVTLDQVITNYDPTKLTVDPDNGAVTVVFTYAERDAAGQYDPTPATVTMPFLDSGFIGDLVWWDIDNDGVQDVGEPGIPDVTVELIQGSTVITTTTDASGIYSFTILSDGDYTVRILSDEFDTGGTLKDWTASPMDAGIDDTVDSDGDPTTHDADVTLAGGVGTLDTDFGFSIVSSYTVTKTLISTNPTRLGQPVTFTITIANTGDTWIDVLPLQDTYNNTFLTYGFGGDFATPDTVDHANDGVLDWTDLTAAAPYGFGADIAPGATRVVTVTFTARADTSALPNDEVVNTVTVAGALADPDGPSGPLPPLVPLPPAESGDGVAIYTPTGVTFEWFGAAMQEGGVLVNWRTASEAEILGFNVLRAADGGAFVPVNPELILAEFAGLEQGAAYAFRDEGQPPGAYTYRLEVIKLDGSAELYGAVDIIVP